MKPNHPSTLHPSTFLHYALLTWQPATWGALLAGLAVILGAFGAHALEQHVSPARLETFEVGVRYQMYHALALLILQFLPAKMWRVAPLFLYGILIFSLSLYILVLTDTAILGAITPIGGTLFIVGWLWLFVLLLRHRW